MTQVAPQVLKSIVAVTAAMSQQGIGKNARNKEQGYNYRGIDDVLNALSAQYAAHNLVIRPSVLEREVIEAKTAANKPLWKVTCKVSYTVLSAVDGSSVECVVYGEAMDTADKATNKAMSAAYKYLAIQLFAIPVEGQPDADAETHQPQDHGRHPSTDARHEPSEPQHEAPTPTPAWPRPERAQTISEDDAVALLKRVQGDGIEESQFIDFLNTRLGSPIRAIQELPATELRGVLALLDRRKRNAGNGATQH
ncbi:Essential recombination function protein [uncultured Caudovirales phage]|uniref:Essential recombination function protein n=1 Tax=uncultured Caudovirales phage TaxID=2100421 RepID=A0A6J5NKE2_9CAUD|nr:Essential recombination function protein [uncultured Caudovirales phage]